MRDRFPRVAALVAGALLLAACASPAAEGPVSGVKVYDEDGLHGAVLPDPYDVPDLALTATDGSSYELEADTDAPLTLVFFGYTKCPDICHIVMADIASALTRLEPDEREQVEMLFVTTDPARDDEATIRGYLDRFDPAFEGLTGPLKRIVEIGNSFGVSIEKGDRLPSGGYEVSHGTQIIGVLPDGTAPVLWTQGTAPDQIAQDIRVVLDEGGMPTGGTS